MTTKQPLTAWLVLGLLILGSAAGLSGIDLVLPAMPTLPAALSGTAAMAQMVGQIINMKYGREDELESDRLGVQFMVDAKYDPRALIEVMKILEEASGGGGRQPPSPRSL